MQNDKNFRPDRIAAISETGDSFTDCRDRGFEAYLRATCSGELMD